MNTINDQVWNHAPAASAGKCSSLLLKGCDFQHPYSNHNKPIANSMWEPHYKSFPVHKENHHWDKADTEYANIDPSLLKVLQGMGWLHLDMAWKSEQKKKDSIT